MNSALWSQGTADTKEGDQTSILYAKAQFF